jgi:hypothetical protein
MSKEFYERRSLSSAEVIEAISLVMDQDDFREKMNVTKTNFCFAVAKRLGFTRLAGGALKDE